MHRILAVAKREYLSRLRSKTFLFGTILLPVAMVLWIAAPGYFASKAAARDVLVLDQSGDGQLFPAIAQRVASARRETAGESVGKPLSQLFRLERREVAPGADIEALRQQLGSERPSGGRERVLLVLRPGVLQDARPEYHGMTLSDPVIDEFGGLLGNALLERRLAVAGVGGSTLAQVSEPPRLERRRLDTTGRVRGEDAENVALVMLATMYTVTFLYGMWVLRGVQADKRSRIVEILLTAARPVELMAGKLLGIGALGLTQCLIWLGGAALLSAQGVAISAALGMQLPRIAPAMLGYFLLYFVLGYFLFGSLYALAGAASTDSDEMQQLQMPLIMLTVVPMMVFFVVLRDPNGTAAVALSLVPFFAPTLMVLRLAVSDPPLWQVGASLALMVASSLGALWFTGKVFRAGILMSGKRQTLPELVRWLRYA
jgi:ABC-2 type transport system permease protein